MNSRPHPFTLRQLQYAVAISETLSFRAAAARCHVSQPSLSAQLAQLEEALGTRLFERDRRTVRATPAGLALVEQARRVLDQADALWDAARGPADPLAGALRLGVLPTIAPYLLPALTPALRRRWPLLRAIWIEDKTGVLMRGMAEDRIDAAIVAAEADLGEVDQLELARDPFLLAARPEDPLARSVEPVSALELDEAAVLLLDDGHCFRDQALAWCQQARAHELQYRATSLSTLSQMVAGGSGVTLLPRLAVPTEARRAGLRVRPFAEPAPYRTIVLAWRPGAPAAASYHRLAQAMREDWPTLP